MSTGADIPQQALAPRLCLDCGNKNEPIRIDRMIHEMLLPRGTVLTEYYALYYQCSCGRKFKRHFIGVREGETVNGWDPREEDQAA